MVQLKSASTESSKDYGPKNDHTIIIEKASSNHRV